MSRHRDVRNMDYSDDYDGYDDIYGHSVDDDYYISPIHRQFIYNRENSGHSRHGEVLQMEQNIQEEDESMELNLEGKLSDDDKKKLESCLEYIKTALAPLNMARQEIVKIIIENNFVSDKVIYSILNTKSERNLGRHDKDDTNFACNSLDGFKKTKKVLISQSSAFPINDQYISNQLKLGTCVPLVTQNGEKNHLNQKCNIHAISQNISKQLKLGTCVPPVTQNGEKNHLNQKCNIQAISPQGISFLSKTKRKDQTAADSDNNLDNDSKNLFFSKIKNLHGEIGIDIKNRQSFFSPKKERTPDEVGVSFLSKIKKSPKLKLDSKGSSVNSTSSHSSFISKIKNLKVQPESECSMDEFSKKFSQHLALGNTNVGNDIVTNKFLNRINVDDCLGQGIKDIQMTKTVDVDKNRLKIIEAKSLPTFRDNNKMNHFNIDLTKALQKNNSEVFKTKIKSSTDRFEIPFFPCDDDLQLHNTDEKILNCTLDISNFILKRTLSNEKRSSRLGEILCLRYKIPMLKKYRKQNLSKDSNKIDKRFNFSTPSPDDKIKKYLRRDL